MRAACALIGSTLPMLVFAIARHVWPPGAWLPDAARPPCALIVAAAARSEMGHSVTASTAGALAIVCDIGALAMTRFILLDPVLLLFVLASAASFHRFRRAERTLPPRRVVAVAGRQGRAAL